MTKLKVSEIFYSIQGEGPQIGMPAWFIRLSGCNLKCEWCDTKYTWYSKTSYDINHILSKINLDQCKNVVITGGEPLLQPKPLFELLKRLAKAKVYVESNGCFYYPYLIGFAKFIVSPKLQFLNKQYEENLAKWAIHSTFKFVIKDCKDFDDAVNLCRKLNKFEDVYFMPEGTIDGTIKHRMLWLVEKVKNKAPFVRVSPRLQIYLYGNKRGK